MKVEDLPPLIRNMLIAETAMTMILTHESRQPSILNDFEKWFDWCIVGFAMVDAFERIRHFKQLSDDFVRLRNAMANGTELAIRGNENLMRFTETLRKRKQGAKGLLE